MPHVHETIGCKGHSLRDRVRHVGRAPLRRQTPLLLLAAVRRQTIRQEGVAMQVFQ